MRKHFNFKFKLSIIIFLFVCFLNAKNVFATDGIIDSSFNYGTGADNLVAAIKLQSDNKVLIVGSFTTYNGTARNRIARLNADGSLDTTFNPGTGANNVIYSAVIQSDGKIIIGGDFTTYNGTARNRIARLNADGSLDTTFNPGTGAASTVYRSILQSDEKIIIVGVFTSYNGTGRSRIARLNTDGSLDTTFNPGTGADNNIYSIGIESDNKILITGKFITYNGTSINRIARLNTDGSLDTSFNVGTGIDNYIQAFYFQSDGKIIIAGHFTSYNGTGRNRIARLNADGSLDTTFNPGTGLNNPAYSIAVQSNNKIIVTGNFTTYNGISRNRIVRLNSNGSIDNGFNPGTGADNLVIGNALQSDDNIIIIGNFITYNGTSVNRIVRLQGINIPSTPSLSPDLVTSSDTGISSTDNITNNNKPSFSMVCATDDDIATLYLNNSFVSTSTCINGYATTTLINSLNDGTHYLSYTEANNKGESNKSTILSLVIDTIAPSLSLIGSNPLNIYINDSFNDPGYSCTDNIDTQCIMDITDTVDTSTVGSYNVTYVANDKAGNTSSVLNRVVNVITGGLPIINLISFNPQKIEIDDGYTELGATAEDFEDGDLTPYINIDSSSVDTSSFGTYDVIYSVTDTNGNSTSTIRKVIVTDLINPTITLTGDKTIEIYVGDTYTDKGATAQDDMDGDITSSIVVNNNLNINNIGTYTITYNVSDSAGNKADEVIRTVIVKARPGGIIWFGNPNNYQINYNNTSPIISNNDSNIVTPTSTNIKKYISPLDNTEKECSPFTKYLKQDSKNNDINQVKLWQAFLNKEVNAKLPITGYLGAKTINAVKLFQSKYADNILKPWNLTKPTGYIYQSTRSYANKIMGCGEGELKLENGVIINYSIIK